MERIIQIMPADGWQGLWVDDSEEAPDGDAVGLFVHPLVGWALCEENGVTTVSGLSAHDVVETCGDDFNFVCYLEPGENPTDHMEDARRKLKRMHGR